MPWDLLQQRDPSRTTSTPSSSPYLHGTRTITTHGNCARDRLVVRRPRCVDRWARPPRRTRLRRHLVLGPRRTSSGHDSSRPLKRTKEQAPKAEPFHLEGSSQHIQPALSKACVAASRKTEAPGGTKPRGLSPTDQRITADRVETMPPA